MDDENMDLEAMLNNPLQNLNPVKARNHNPVIPPERQSAAESAAKREIPVQTAVSGASKMEENHPFELRVLGMEKNGLIAAKRLEDIKRVIEHQNERIRLLEEEMRILRDELGKEEK